MIYAFRGRRYRVQQTDASLVVEQEQQRQGEARWVRVHPRMNYCKSIRQMRPPPLEVRLLLERIRGRFALAGADD